MAQLGKKDFMVFIILSGTDHYLSGPMSLLHAELFCGNIKLDVSKFNSLAPGRFEQNFR